MYSDSYDESFEGIDIKGLLADIRKQISERGFLEIGEDGFLKTEERGANIAMDFNAGFSREADVFYPLRSRFGQSVFKLSNREKMNPDNIKKVIFNRPATIVIFKDDSKYVVKCNDEDFDEEKGLAMVFMNLAFDDNRSERKRFVDQAIEDNKPKKPKKK